MKSLIVMVVLLVPMCLAGTDPHKEAMIKANKTPKQAVAPYNNACDECKLIVTRFNEAAKDPSKMDELKNLLTMLCDTTSYARECKLLVSRLDLIVKELEPYLRDPANVCKRLHFCGSDRTQKIQRLGLIFVKQYLNRMEGTNDIMCDECQFAVAELKSIVETRSSQQEIKDLIHQVCGYLGQYRGTCDELAEQFLPELFEALEQFLQNSKQVCVDLGLCNAREVIVNGQPLHSADMTNARSPQLPKTYRLKSFVNMLNNLQTKNGIYMSCWECEFVAAAMLTEMGTDTICNTISNDLRPIACDDVLPTAYKVGCEDFLTLYLPTVYKMTISQLNSTFLCKDVMKVCDAQKTRTNKRLSATQKAAVICESCKGITDFVRNEIETPDFQVGIENGLREYLCVNLPTSVRNLCENIVQSYTPLALEYLTAKLNSQTVCKDDLHMCSTEMLEQIGN